MNRCSHVQFLKQGRKFSLIIRPQVNFTTTTNRPCTTGLCLVSVWAGTRPPPPLHVWSPHRSDFAPLGAASSPAFWGSSARPGHRPRAPRDTAYMSRCSLMERSTLDITTLWRSKMRTEDTYYSLLYQAGLTASCPDSPTASWSFSLLWNEPAQSHTI